ncbi:MAG: hypothetical protein Q8Q09_29555 [Deltaproteobacteria bacterium]|nr:hypothetical protein [Deltaproteobacteria bacterium]
MKASSLALGLFFLQLFSSQACGNSVAPATDAAADQGTRPDATSSDVTTPVIPPVNGCYRLTPTAVYAPSVLFAGQPLGLTVEDRRGMGLCACTPTLAPLPISSARGYSLQACSCCENCDCVDRGYAASELLGAVSGPRVDLLVEGEPERRSVRVVNSSTSCESRSMVIGDVTVVGPDELRVSGPRLYWARVTGTHRGCCESLVGFVDRVAGRSIELTPMTCDTTTCEACDPIERRPNQPFTSDHLLGALAAGSWTLNVAGTTRTFEVTAR